jgi:hypothetical protein
MSARDSLICEKFKQGATSIELADEFGLSHQRIQQILASSGLGRKDGGKRQATVRLAGRIRELIEETPLVSDEEIAKRLGLSSAPYIAEIRRAFEIEKDSRALRSEKARRHRGTQDFTKELFQDLYETRGLTQAEIAKELKVSAPTVSNYMKRFGIDARPRGKSVKRTAASGK